MNYSIIEREDLKELNSFLKKNTPLLGKGSFELERKIGNDSFLLLKFFENSKITGFGESELLGGGDARINFLMVDERLRGKGLGTEIIECILTELKKRGIERVFLYVESGNLSAKRLYERAGFEFIGLFQDETGESIEEMEIELETVKPSYVS